MDPMIRGISDFQGLTSEIRKQFASSLFCGRIISSECIEKSRDGLRLKDRREVSSLFDHIVVKVFVGLENSVDIFRKYFCRV